eukprot:TRINITY_DN7130_c0_g1_i1.p1 TRINITY_DN7130_c0_g1~~TRINITY_DN7130_c0_g1_i1.p1  ORF type:complete len:148 (+),score=16.52 TRINITY_DN7130_c0_g1_i1:24-467(+)
MELSFDETYDFDVLGQFGEPHEEFSVYTNHPVLLWYGEHLVPNNLLIEPMDVIVKGYHGSGDKALIINFSDDSMMYAKEVLRNLSVGLNVRAVDTNGINSIILRTDAATMFETGQSIIVETLYVCLIDAYENSILFLATNDLVQQNL